ncbi:MAG: hypothetical protein JWQ89_4549 [Devosia sp.]|uniref:hypothetical protein n=1 Tax=Devosia sp. TaxID=1871048 RepID=UPI0026307D94|nr:hypothetical protein [Devosia sp.]MDB5542822.1 hypothetical protein [Devosia sp.]
MTRKSPLVRRTTDFISLFGAANAAAAATHEHRTPRARDLQALGIKPADFKAIRQ